MRLDLFKRRRPPAPVWTEPITIANTEGETIVALSPERVTGYRHVHTRLSRSGTLPPLIGLTAALREEGVTSVALGLAAVAAHDVEEQICVVDLNLRWPALAERAGVAPAPGLADLVTGRAKADDALRPTGLDNLWLLPAGDLAGDSPSRLARGRALSAALNSLSRQFDHLILDLPALLATDDAVPLAEHANSLLLVIRQGAVPLPLIKEALDQVAHLPVAGTVLNGSEASTPTWLLRLIGGAEAR